NVTREPPSKPQHRRGGHELRWKLFAGSVDIHLTRFEAGKSVLRQKADHRRERPLQSTPGTLTDRVGVQRFARAFVELDAETEPVRRVAAADADTDEQVR